MSDQSQSASGKGSATAATTIYGRDTNQSAVPGWVWLAVLGVVGLVIFGGILYLAKK